MDENIAKAPAYVRKELTAPKNVVKSGSRGLAVERVQEWLTIHKIETEIDGAYGPATAACVREFQALHQLPESGRVNPATWKALTAPMLRALTPPVLPAGSSLAAAVQILADQHVAEHPVEVGGPNCGPWVRLYCEGNDGVQWAWCAGFVSFLIRQGAAITGEAVPVKGSVSCDILANQAKDAGRFVSGRELVKKQAKWADLGGIALFLKRRTATDWVHTGFAVDAEGKGKNLVFNTIEGNTNIAGGREGFEACRRKRSLSGSYDFVRLA